MGLKNLFPEPRLQGIVEGSPEWFAMQKKIILSRPLMKHHYDMWYKHMIADARSAPKGVKLELGSGGSYLKRFGRTIITSDVLPGIAENTIDAMKLPYKKNTVSALFLTHVFHHVPDVQKFLSEANRVLKKGGVISLVETTSTPFARFFYTHFHPEPHNTTTKKWTFKWGHNMHDSNQALSWIVFVRDEKKFQKLFPNLVVEKKRYLPWLSYALSGGVTRKNLIPKPLVPVLKFFDWLLTPLNFFFALSWHITIRKK